MTHCLMWLSLLAALDDLFSVLLTPESLHMVTCADW
jgi:hypothetical protein